MAYTPENRIVALIVLADDATPSVMEIARQLLLLHQPTVLVLPEVSSPGTEVIEQLLLEHPQTPASECATVSGASLTIIRSSARRALQAGLSEAVKTNCAHIITIHADREFNATDVPALLAAAAEHPLALILGVPSAGRPTSGFTRFRGFLLRLETGLRVIEADGLPRLYPRALIEQLTRRGRPFNSIELLAHAGWIGCPVVETTLPSSAPASDLPAPRSLSLPRVLAVLGTHLKLLVRELSGLPHPKYDALPDSPTRKSVWFGFWRWFDPRPAWRELRDGRANPNELAAAIAVGVFIANLPAYGTQTVLSLYVARRLHLHPVAVVAGSQASAPPLGPALIVAAIWMGHLVLHRSCLSLGEMNPLHGSFYTRGGPLLIDWAVGSIVVGVATAAIVFVAANMLFRGIGPGEGGSHVAESSTGAMATTTHNSQLHMRNKHEESPIEPAI